MLAIVDTNPCSFNRLLNQLITIHPIAKST